MKKRQSGYSLIEVLVAIAITSVVLLTVVTLFYMGRRNVYSGKQTTAAVAIGTRIMEDLSAMTAEDIHTAFDIDDATTPTTVILENVYGAPDGKLTYNDSLARNTSVCTVDTGTGVIGTKDAEGVEHCGATDVDAYLAKWMRLVVPDKDKNAVFTKPEIGLILTPRNPSDATKKWTTARFTKVRAYVAWDEGQGRRRFAFFDTTKVIR
jgi:prepilin-type N-terminal cleavage/methylation domain-containing protein